MVNTDYQPSLIQNVGLYVTQKAHKSINSLTQFGYRADSSK